jgi:GT2 family glycosyltransferase
MKIMEYSVVIRTLGTAGEKYQKLLNSLKNQTVLPKKILVYIPEGYKIPKETIGIEEYIISPKGMVAQRSLPFKEVNTEYILFSDDDMFYPETFGEKMLKAADNLNADCIAPDFQVGVENNSFWYIVKSFLYSSTSIHQGMKWAVKIKKDAGFSRNISPQVLAMPTQSAPGGALFVKKTAYEAIHFEDERWLDKFMFASYDDQLFNYKLFLQGFKSFFVYHSGVRHLDARASKRPDNKLRMYYKRKLLFIVWYRSIFDIDRIKLQKSIANKYPANEVAALSSKFSCICSFLFRNIIGMLPMFADVVRYRQPKYMIDYFEGFYAGYKFVQTEEYKKIPSFDAYIN